jgi:hypothetical protein
MAKGAAFHHRISARGHFHMEVFCDGVLVEVYDDHNLVVTAGLVTLANLLGNNLAVGGLTQIGYGVDNTAAQPTDTALTGALLVPFSAAPTYPSPGAVLFPFACSTTQGNGMEICEFGLLSANGNLFARKTRSVPIYKSSAVSFIGTWTITFEAP